MTEPTDEQIQQLAEMLGGKSILTGTLTVDRSNEEVNKDGESTDQPSDGSELSEPG